MPVWLFSDLSTPLLAGYQWTPHRLTHSAEQTAQKTHIRLTWNLICFHHLFPVTHSMISVQVSYLQLCIFNAAVSSVCLRLMRLPCQSPLTGLCGPVEASFQKTEQEWVQAGSFWVAEFWTASTEKRLRDTTEVVHSTWLLIYWASRLKPAIECKQRTDTHAHKTLSLNSAELFQLCWTGVRKHRLCGWKGKL